MDVDAARRFVAGLNLHTSIEAQAAQWIGYLCDQVEWARDELSSMRDREDCRD